jgi:hypothetical protein
VKNLLALAAAVEAATGVVLVVDPHLVADLLVGGDLTGAGPAVGRVAGLALLALGVACWPGTGPPHRVAPSLRALLIYNPAVAVYLFCLAVGGGPVGILLWPAMALHAALTLLLARAWLRRVER